MMTKPRIGVVVHTKLRDQIFSAADQDRLGLIGDVIWTDSALPISVDAAAELLRDCDIGIGSWQTPYPTEPLLSACPSLRLWEHAAGSVKHMFGPHLDGRNLMIASCKTAIADSVAEMVLAQAILGLRRVFENCESNRTAITSHPTNMRVLRGSTVGVVGASQVGRRVIRLLQPFGCRILLYDPYVTAEEARNLGATKLEDLIALCVAGDVVTVHTPNVPACRHQLGAAHFQAMSSETVFINSARGACIDEAALVVELEKGRLTAFLDVTNPEPPVIDSPLRRLPNVFYTSHIAGPPSMNIGSQAVDDVEAFSRGEPPLCVVTADELEYTG